MYAQGKQLPCEKVLKSLKQAVKSSYIWFENAINWNVMNKAKILMESTVLDRNYIIKDALGLYYKGCIGRELK